MGVCTAAVVLFQNARLTVLWDLSYILENATRIAMGDVPYRDFPFPYAPLTFLVQALIIRIFGRALWHHTAYAMLAGGAATALTYLIVRRITSRAAAVILTLPLIVLGIYCIFPHPFYDPDCCLAILMLLYASVSSRHLPSHPSSPRGATRRCGASFALGLACVIPLLIKQNIGLAFLLAVIALSILAREWRLLAGIGTGSAIALALITAIFGINDYIHWTIRFAAARRLPPIATVLSIYVDPTLMWWLACAALAAVLARWNRIAAGIVASAPFAWSIARIFLTDDPVERQINLLKLWPLVLVCGAIAGIFALARRDIVPLLVVAAVHGALLSQSTWGSTYGIWPLLVILAAYATHRAPSFVAAGLSAALLFGGIPYVIKNERLTYAKLDMPWRADFEQLVAWTDAHIPRGDAILCMPGEDLFYFTTGRRPRFPVLMFDRTINPYDAATIDRIARERNVRWVIVKHRLQLNGTPMEELGATTSLIAARSHVAAELRNYTVWRTGVPGTHE